MTDAKPNDFGKLKGYPFYRVDIGEYRVFPDYIETSLTVACHKANRKPE